MHFFQCQIVKFQVDGSADNWSRSSQSPPHSLSSADEIDNDEVSSVIRKRMKQIADNRPKSKFALIKRVFSTYTKNRKIVVVKYKVSESRIYDREEYEDRKRDGTLDEPYDEEADDVTLKVKSSAAVLKRKGSVTEAESSVFEPPQVPLRPESVREVEERESTSGAGGDEADFHCSECSRSFPNLIRFHAHMQMHKDGATKKRKSAPGTFLITVQ
jgi:hypothetical protein